MESETEPDLVARARQGDRAARDQLIVRQGQGLVRVAQSLIRPGARRYVDAEDLAQQVLGEFLASDVRFTSLDELNRQMVMRVRNRYVNLWARRMQRHQDADSAAGKVVGRDLETRAPLTGPVTHARRGEGRERFEAALVGEAPLEAMLLRLRLLQELEFQAMAQRTGLPSADAARMRYNRVLPRFLRRLKELGGLDGMAEA